MWGFFRSFVSVIEINDEEDDKTDGKSEDHRSRPRKSKNWLKNQQDKSTEIANEELVGTMKFFAEVYKDKKAPLKLRMEAARELKSEAMGKPSLRKPTEPIGSAIPPLNFDLGSIDDLKNSNKPDEPIETEPSGDDEPEEFDLD